MLVAFAVGGMAISASGSTTREFPVKAGSLIEVFNPAGKVRVEALDSLSDKAVLQIAASDAEKALKISSERGLRIEVAAGTRIDIVLAVPERMRFKVRTDGGEVFFTGNFESFIAETDTGTIAADVPTDDLRYQLFWTSSRPRVLSDFDLEKIKERSAGRFEIKGHLGERLKNKTPKTESEQEADQNAAAAVSRSVSISLTTARGIIVLNVPPGEVTADLRERPLTEAAKAIIRSGDAILMESIRRAAPKYFGDYARTLPPAKREPFLAARSTVSETPGETVKRALVRFTDINDRAVANISQSDISVTERGASREVLSVRPANAPVNLVLLLDVSGSVDNYVNFIRKAARSFVNTVSPQDRISIIIFNDDVKTLAGFTTDKGKLSESLDTFDAGGGTAYYDALAYTLAESLRPLQGERTAIVVLTDGDDNRSFLAFDSLAGAIQESGALIYPLYVPSTLIAASASSTERTLDPLRSRYTGLTTKAEGEGEKLASISGGVYYPITQLSQIQAAYDDIVRQLRTAYIVEFRSATQPLANGRPSPTLKIRSSRDNIHGSVISVVGIGR